MHTLQHLLCNTHRVSSDFPQLDQIHKDHRLVNGSTEKQKMSTPTSFQWQTDAFDIEFTLNSNGVVCLSRVLPKGSKEQPRTALFESSEVPLVSVKLVGEGNTSDKTSKAMIGGYLSARLKYESHAVAREGSVQTLSIENKDEATKIRITVRLTVYGSIPILRSLATITNQSTDNNIAITQLSSLAIGGLTNSSTWFHDYIVLTANNSWFREAQWREHTLPDLGLDNNGICELPDGHTGSQSTVALESRGSFSTGSYLPMGLLVSKDKTNTWIWQIENNGSWRWEIGDYKDSLYLVASGPTGVTHNWKQVLAPGEEFTTVPACIGRVNGDFEKAFAALTDYRRVIRRPHPDLEKLPIVFNDYMNCLMGDPDEEKIKALLGPVAQSGAEYFVIDAGWYADDSNWWDDVGLWEPSKKRFPSGFKMLTDEIKAKGLIPGLWLEPEVVGVRSVVGNILPKDAFFQEDGERIIERGRFQLDFRHEQVISWMNKVINRLIADYGVGFFKFDYNIEVVQGTDTHRSSSAGAEHLEHHRAYLAWVRSLLDKYPNLVIENCSSGGQRMEYAMLAIHPLQSNSDQQDPALYGAISAAAPTAVTPEQSASWAYPQPEWDDELNALSVVNSLLGRVFLSGRLDTLSSEQLKLIVEGMDVYKLIRQDIKKSRATWPLGLPQWHDDWLSLGLVSESNETYLGVWRRGGSTEIDIPLKNLPRSNKARVKVLYPTTMSTEVAVKDDVLTVKLPEAVCARLLHIYEG